MPRKTQTPRRIDGRLLKAIRKRLGIKAIDRKKRDEEWRKQNKNVNGAWGISLRTLRRYESGKAMVTDETLSKIFASQRQKAIECDQRPDAKGKPLLPQVNRLQCEIIKQACDYLVNTRMDFLTSPEVSTSLKSEVHKIAKLITPSNPEQEAIQASLLGNPERAAQILHKLQKEDREQLVHRCILLGENWSRNGMFAKAIAPLQEAHALAPVNTEIIFLLVKAYLISGGKSNWEAAFTLLQSNRLRNEEVTAKKLMWLGIAWFNNAAISTKERIGKSLQYFRKAIAEPISDDDLAALTKSHLAVSLFLTKKPAACDEALALFTESLKTWSKQKHPYNLNVGHKRLGNFYLLRKAKTLEERTNYLDKAEWHYQKAARSLAIPEFSIEFAQLEYTQADLYRARAEIEPQKSLQHLKKAISFCKSAIRKLTFENRNDWHRAHFNLAEAYFRRPMPTKAEIQHAIASYQEAAKPYSNNYDRFWWAETHDVLAEAALALSQRTNDDCQPLALAIRSLKACVSVTTHPQVAEWQARLAAVKLKYQEMDCSQQLSFSKLTRAE